MLAPSLAALKALFARSGNRCAFLGCDVPIAESSGTVTAEVCHIRALNPRGPRYDSTQTPEGRNSVDNLLLLCGRHHKLVDTETRRYTAPVLLAMKRSHEELGIVEIPPQSAPVAQQLLEQYERISVAGTNNKVVVGSPGAVVADTVNFKSAKTRPKVAPPPGSIGASIPKAAYCTRLIHRYNEFQKRYRTGKSTYKYMALPFAIERHFKAPWQLLPEDRFPDVAAFLQKRLDATIIGRINLSKGSRNYHPYGELPSET